jgi:hypothetical protein
MQPKDTIDNGETIEAVVGVFADQTEASRVAASIRTPDLDLQRVSRRNPTATDAMPDLVYDQIEEVSSLDVAAGVVQGGAIGAGSGLLLLGVPVINVFAPIAGALAGAFIGGVAGVDEAKRGIRLPNLEDYQRKLAAGKSIIVISGDEATRQECENKMNELGAEETFQHPPVQQQVREPADD